MFIDIDAKSTLEYLVDLEDKLDDPTPLMKEISGVLVDAIEENFRKEGRPEKWAELSEVTLARRRHRSGKILQPGNRGGLAASITSSHSRDEAAAGTNKIYATTMNFGAKKGEFGETKHGVPIPWGDIPARSFMNLAEDDLEEIREISFDYLDI